MPPTDVSTGLVISTWALTSIALKGVQSLFNIKGALTKPVQHGVVGGVQHQPSLVLTQQAFSHSRSQRTARTFERCSAATPRSGDVPAVSERRLGVCDWSRTASVLSGKQPPWLLCSGTASTRMRSSRGAAQTSMS